MKSMRTEKLSNGRWLKYLSNGDKIWYRGDVDSPDQPSEHGAYHIGAPKHLIREKKIKNKIYRLYDVPTAALVLVVIQNNKIQKVHKRYYAKYKEMTKQMRLSNMLKLADRLCEASKLAYSHNGLKLTELLIAINEYELAKEDFINSAQTEVQVDGTEYTN